jgi:D-alanyl-D-alanine dipeptidase
VFLTTFTGTQITLVVGINDTVNQFKELVTQKTGIPDAQQLLSYAGKKLANGMRICQYNIRNMSTVQLVTQVHGGVNED